ncbi:MAG: DNA gyrase inhibitor YacG [Planctomycetota bacterium]|nr:DNA gyrase inhibitor YacG [Planctomycetota bacterium]
MSKTNFSAKCPTCGRDFTAAATAAHMPFCSDRCKLADLHRWMSEEIGIPTGSSEPEDEPEPEPPPSQRQWNFD